MSHPKPGPAERYVRDYTFARQARAAEQGWTEMERALVMTLIDWKVESEMRPTSGPGSDCSDLMDTALARIAGLASGDLTPAQVLDSIEGETVPEPPCRMCLRDDCRGGCF